MRVLLHCVYYPPELGGLESHVAGLAEGLVQMGHEVRVVTSRSRPGLAEDEVVRGVRVRRTWMPGRNPLGWSAFALESVPWTREWARWAEVLHAQAFASILPVGVAARASGRPWVASLHTSHFLRRARLRRWRPILRWMVKWPDHVLSASREIADVAGTLAPGTPIEAVTNGVDTDRFRPPDGGSLSGEGERTIIVPRRLFRKNGVEHLIRALPRVCERVPLLRARIVGDGPERTRLEALSLELGVADAVTFLGARPHESMPELLTSGELAVFPSLMEATSVAALEAMSCGLPVVATSVGGLPEIVDDEVGALVPPADAEALADGIVRILEDPDREALGRRARERVVASWSNRRLVERHVAIYEDLVAGRPVAGPSRADAG